MTSANETIKRCIRQIIEAGGGGTQSFNEGGRLINGFVTAVNKEEGTIDMVGFENEFIVQGATLSSVIGNSRGDISYPELNSDISVIISNDGSQAYVIAFTHLTEKHIEANDYVFVGVTEKGEGGDDYDERPDTGKKSNQEYTPDQIKAIVEYQNKSSKITQTYQKIKTEVGQNVSQEISEEKIENNVGDANTILESQKFSVLATKIVFGNEANAENAVLGLKLQALLQAFIQATGMITTTTLIGAMPILNKAQVDALQAQIPGIVSKVVFNE